MIGLVLEGHGHRTLDTPARKASHTNEIIARKKFAERNTDKSVTTLQRKIS